MRDIANSYGMNPSNLNKILNQRCGDTWEQSFKSKRLKINEAIVTTIPRLLDESVIKKIRERSNSNKTYTHGIYKHQYLLSGLIFDNAKKCALTGTANMLGQRYYRPYNVEKEYRYMINADALETSFVDGFNDLLQHQDYWKTAVFDGDSIKNHADKLKDELEIVNKDIATKKKTKDSSENKLIACDDAAFKDLQEKLKKNIGKITEDISDLEIKRDKISNQLKTLPTLAEVEDRRKRLKKALQ
jgi:hypothetical protein